MTTNTNTRKASRLNPDFTAAALEMEGRDHLAAAVRAGDMTAEAAEAEARRERAAEAESEARAAEAVRTREAADHAAETAEAARRAAAKLARTREDAARTVTRPETAEAAADLDRLAREIETAEAVAGPAAETAEARRAEYIAARAALRAADLLAYMESDPRALLDLAAAAVSRAIDRREAESGAHGPTIRATYGRTEAAAIGETLNGDAVNEAAADLLEMVTGGWMDGETDDGTPRAALPLAYVAAIAAGRALDRIIYADGGRAVKLTAKEARDAYRNAADLAPLADRADLLAEEAKADPTPERIAAAKEARAEYMTAARRHAAAAVVVETRRTSDPIAPGPEAAAVNAERVARVLDAVRPAVRDNAAAVVVAVYEGAETLREAAEAAGIGREAARRAWEAVRNAAAVILAEDGETAAAALARAFYRAEAER